MDEYNISMTHDEYALWEEAYIRIGWQNQQEIDQIAEMHGLTRIEAMQKRFKNRIDIALTGQMPRDFDIMSQKEQKEITETLRNPETASVIRALIAESDVEPEKIRISDDDDPELRNWKKRNQ